MKVDDKPAFDTSIIFRVLLCLFLGACLYLYITNNSLFANGARNFQHPEAIAMFFVIGVPFVLALLHLVRSLRRPPEVQT